MRWVALIFFLSACGGTPAAAPATPEAKALAECLAAHGVTMYGAFWCPHCAAQKEVFGDAFAQVTYVECSNPDRTQTQVCIEHKILGYPTWVFPDASRLEGEQTLAQLKEKSGC